MSGSEIGRLYQAVSEVTTGGVASEGLRFLRKVMPLVASAATTRTLIANSISSNLETTASPTDPNPQTFGDPVSGNLDD